MATVPRNILEEFARNRLYGEEVNPSQDLLEQRRLKKESEARVRPLTKSYTSQFPGLYPEVDYQKFAQDELARQREAERASQVEYFNQQKLQEPTFGQKQQFQQQQQPEPQVKDNIPTPKMPSFERKEGVDREPFSIPKPSLADFGQSELARESKKEEQKLPSKYERLVDQEYWNNEKLRKEENKVNKQYEKKINEYAKAFTDRNTAKTVAQKNREIIDGIKNEWNYAKKRGIKDYAGDVSTGIMLDLAHGTLGAGVGINEALSGALDLQEDILPISDASKKGHRIVTDYVKRSAKTGRDLQERIEKIHKPTWVAKGTEFAQSLPAYALSNLAGGPVIGFGALSGLQSRGRGEPLKQQLNAVRHGATTGLLFKGAHGKSALKSMGILGGGMAAQTAIDGGSAEDIRDAAMSGMMLSQMPGMENKFVEATNKMNRAAEVAKNKAGTAIRKGERQIKEYLYPKEFKAMRDIELEAGKKGWGGGREQRIISEIERKSVPRLAYERAKYEVGKKLSDRRMKQEYKKWQKEGVPEAEVVQQEYAMPERKLLESPKAVKPEPIIETESRLLRKAGLKSADVERMVAEGRGEELRGIAEKVNRGEMTDTQAIEAVSRPSWEAKTFNGYPAKQYITDVAKTSELNTALKIKGLDSGMRDAIVKEIERRKEGEPIIARARREGVDKPIDTDDGSKYIFRQASKNELNNIIKGNDSGVFWTTDPRAYLPNEGQVTIVSKTNDRNKSYQKEIADGREHFQETLPRKSSEIVDVIGRNGNSIISDYPELSKEAPEVPKANDLLSEARKYKTAEEFVDKTYNDLAQLQRNKPESAMLDATNMDASGIYGYMLEHGGDIIHRMNEGFNGVYAKPKIINVLADLKNYSVADINDQIASNLKYKQNNGQLLDETVESWTKKLKEKSKIYSDEHRKLPVYNEAQKLAQDTAIAIGEWRFDDAIKALEKLKDKIDDGSWEKFIKESDQLTDIWNKAHGKDVQRSIKNLDEEYSKAIESGDKESAQQLVDEAAKDAGYTIDAWHTSKDKHFRFRDEFKTELSSMGFHFGTESQAKFRTGQFDFVSKKPSTNKYYLSIKNPLEVSHMASFAPDHLAEQMIGSKMLTEEKYVDILDDIITDQDVGEKLVKILQKNGYDGLKYINEREGEGYSYVPFNPEQIKSADAITYDNNGNVIPLSERFKEISKDVRYSMKGSKEKSVWMDFEKEAPSSEYYDLLKEGMEKPYDIDALNEDIELAKDRLSKMGIDADIQFENKYQPLNINTVEGVRFLKQSGLSQEEIQDAIKNKKRFIIEGEHRIYTDKRTGQRRSTIKIFRGFDEKTIWHEAAHAIHEHGGLPNWNIQDSEVLARELADRYGRGEWEKIPELTPEGSKIEVGKKLVNSFGKTETAPTYSVQSWEATNKKTLENGLLKSGLSSDLTNKFFKDMEEVVNFIKAYPAILQRFPNQDYSTVKSNADAYYKKSFDVMTICRKAFSLIDAVSKEQVKRGRGLTANEWVELRKELADRGDVVSCVMCYVFSRKMLMGNTLDTLHRIWPEIPKEIVFDLNRHEELKNYKTTDKQIRKLVKESGTAEKIKKAKAKILELKILNKKKTLTKPEENKLAKLKKEEPSIKKDLEELQKIDSYGKMRKKIQTPHDFISTRGAGLGKVFQPYTDYRREFSRMGKETVERQNKVSGQRFQSWSDLVSYGLIDYMQAVADLSKVKSMAHSYAKVVDLVDIMRETNMAINISLVPKGTGLDPKGKPVFDPVEGVPYEEALKRTRIKDGKPIGNESIGISDKHIRALGKSKDIHFIIPNHASGASDEVRKLAKINHWTNYEGKWVDGKQLQSEAIADQKKFDKYMKWKTSKDGGNMTAKQEHTRPWEWWDEKWTLADDAKITKTYLDYCKKNGIRPAMPHLVGMEGYWKMLVDRRMFDENGKYIRQLPLVPNFNMDAVNKYLNSVISGEIAGEGQIGTSSDDVIGDMADEAVEVQRSIKEMPPEEQGKQRGFAETVEGSESVTPEVKRKMKGIRYDPITNIDTIEQAKKIIDANPEEAYARINRKDHNATDTAIGMLTAQRMMQHSADLRNAGDHANANLAAEQATSIIEDISRKATTHGQAIQILSQWDKLGPEGIINLAIRTKANTKGATKIQKMVDRFKRQDVQKNKDVQPDIVYLERAYKKLGVKLTKEESGRLVEFGEQIRKLGEQADKALAEGNEQGYKEFELDKFEKTREAMSYIKEIAPANWMDKFLELRASMFLTGLKTHVVNVVSQLYATGLRPAETVFAAAVEAAKQAGSNKYKREIFFGETPADVYGMVSAIPSATRAAINSAIDSWKGLPSPSSKQLELFSIPAVKGTLGKIIRIPFHGLSAMDDAFVTWNKMGKLHALAYRKAAYEGYKGKELLNKTAEYVANPPEELLEIAEKQALTDVFKTKLGKSASQINKVRSEKDIIGYASKYVVPFFATPANVPRHYLIRSPFGLAAPTNWEGWRTGGAASSEATARVVLGSLIGTTALLYAMGEDDEGRPLVTGSMPSKKSERELWYRLGIVPYSIRIGDHYYSYQRLQPFGFHLGTAAALSKAIKNKDDKKITELGSVLFKDISMQVVDQPFLTGVRDILNAMTEPDRYGQNWIERQVSGLPSFPVLGSHIAQAIDPILRKTDNLGDIILSRVPFLSEYVPPRRDFWGEEITRPGNIPNRILSPVPRREVVESKPIDREFLRLNFAPNAPTEKIYGKPLSPEIYDEYRIKFGRSMLKNYDRLIKTEGYKNASGDEQKAALKKMYNEGTSAFKKIFYKKQIDADMTMLMSKTKDEKRKYIQEMINLGMVPSLSSRLGKDIVKYMRYKLDVKGFTPKPSSKYELPDYLD